MEITGAGRDRGDESSASAHQQEQDETDHYGQ